MCFQLDISLTEEDYLAFNCFHSFESKYGKKMVMRSRVLFIAIMAGLITLVILSTGWTSFAIAYAVIAGLITALYMLYFKKSLRRNMKKQIEKVKKIGKLPFAPLTRFEFYDDRLIEITATSRTEHIYDSIERICMVSEQFILLYNSSVGAHILPIPQLREQLDQEAFFSFLTQKCSTIEFY